ncbi:MAG: FISUMP domain-containing protein [Dysgonomonas sp.]
MKRLNFIASILTITALVVSTAKAQVTIGSGKPPVLGALIQLKENENLKENSAKGLILPRVRLSDKENLFPMFTATGNTNSDYSDPTYKSEQDKLHIGLVVYNTNPCLPFGKGVFIWDGQSWEAISKPIFEGYSTIASLPDTLHIASGMDKRVWEAVTMSFDYSSSQVPSWSNLLAIGGYNGLSFTNQATQISPYPAIWTNSPAVFSVRADKITSLTKMKPWATRQSSVTISLGADTCGPEISKTVLLNQTNYAISGRGFTSSNTSTDENDLISMITIRDANPQQIKVLSNTRWQASIEPTGGNVSDVLSNYTQAIQGQIHSDGSFSQDYFSYTGVGDIPATRFKYVTVNLKDVDGRAEDFPITIMQCQGSEDLSSVTVTADPAQTSNTQSNWGSAVVHHLEKAGYYKDFYSADFGVAGRWMITNLAAANYSSSIVLPSGFSLTYGVVGSLAGGNVNQGYYSYPNANVTAYNANPYMGYLYNFSGATGGAKIGVNANQANNPSLPSVQGICPDGWHVPSDYEWTQLENEIIDNTTKYAYVSKNIIDDGGQHVPGSTSGGNYRGTHAPAMTNACEVYQGNVEGTSKRLSEGGFGAYFAGEIIDGSPLEFGVAAIYWTSSTGPLSSNGTDPQAYYRVMATSVGDAGVSAFNASRKHYMAVRCKKN